jgi:hypothetical protein
MSETDRTRGTPDASHRVWEPRKLGGDKLALLGLFVLALLAARFVVALKSAIPLSGPIELPHAGLSVSVPRGNGWHSEEKWEFQENAFVVSSVLTLASSHPVAQARCRYLLATEPTAHRIRFEQRASEVDGTIVKTDQTRAAALAIDWVHIEKPEILLDTFMGTAELPDNRQFDIEVSQITGDTELAERTFKAIVDSLSFKDNQLLGAGAEIIGTIKSKGLGSFLDNHAEQTFYLIEDSTGHPIGFATDALMKAGRDAPFNIQAAGFSYIGRRHTLEQATSFQCGDNLDEFVYKSEARGSTGRNGTEAVFHKTGTMTVTKSGVRPEEENYRLGPAAIPDVFLDQVLGQMLDCRKEEIIVDIVEAHGKVTPTFVSKIEAAKDSAGGQDAAYAFKLELLDGRGFTEQVYLNDRKQIYRMLLQQQDSYIVERSTAEDIIREFPGYAQYVLQNHQTLK